MSRTCQRTMDTLQHAKFDSHRSRVVLSKKAAREIFIVKSNLGLESAHQASIRLAAKYRISSKAIRDIWKGRSWLDATFDLWSEEDRPCRRVIGRPKGKKDSKPRAKARAGQDAHGNDGQCAASASRPPFMTVCDYSDECRFQYAPQFHASRASESCHHSLSFSFGKQNPWSMDPRQACLLPSFGSLIQDIRLVSTIPDPFAQQAASPHCASFPTHPLVHQPAFPTDRGSLGSFPPMYGGAGAQGSLLALMASHVLSPRSALAVTPTPFGLARASSSPDRLAMLPSSFGAGPFIT